MQIRTSAIMTRAGTILFPPKASSLSFNQSCRLRKCTDESHFKRSSVPTPRPENSRHAQQPHVQQPCVQQPWAWSGRVDLCRPKSDLPVESPLQKYFRSLLTQITCISLAIPSRTEGRFAI